MRALLGPLIFHGLNFLTGLIAVDQLASLGLQETFLNVGREGAAFFLGPALFGFLGFKSVADDVLGIRIGSAGEALLHQSFKIGRDGELHRLGLNSVVDSSPLKIKHFGRIVTFSNAGMVTMS